MEHLHTLISALISFGASVIGAVCGIGGGIIIKPLLDLLGAGSVSTIGFLSSCTVLSMSLYSVGRSFRHQEETVDLKLTTPLAIGAAIGGIAGNSLFVFARGAFENPNRAGMIQSVLLLLITAGTMLYTLLKQRIKTHSVRNGWVVLLIGLLLGTMSSFLGIGGGPINLVVLFFFFSMETKTAAANSLYIILLSQIANVLFTIITRSVPPFQPMMLLLMVLGGIAGGVIGRAANKRMQGKTVDKLFIGLMAAIILICIYNTVRFAQIA